MMQDHRENSLRYWNETHQDQNYDRDLIRDQSEKAVENIKRNFLEIKEGILKRNILRKSQ